MKTGLLWLLLFAFFIFSPHMTFDDNSEGSSLAKVMTNIFRSRPADTAQDIILLVSQDGKSSLVNKNTGDTSWSLQLSLSALSYLSGPGSEFDLDDRYMVEVGYNDEEIANSIEMKFLKIVADYFNGVKLDSDDRESLLEMRYTTLHVDLKSGKALEMFDQNPGKKINDEDMGGSSILHIARRDYTIMAVELWTNTLWWNITFTTFEAKMIDQDKKLLRVPVIHVRDGSHVRFVDSISSRYQN